MVLQVPKSRVLGICNMTWRNGLKTRWKRLFSIFCPNWWFFKSCGDCTCKEAFMEHRKIIKTSKKGKKPRSICLQLILCLVSTKNSILSTRSITNQNCYNNVKLYSCKMCILMLQPAKIVLGHHKINWILLLHK